MNVAQELINILELSRKEAQKSENLVLKIKGMNKILFYFHLLWFLSFIIV